MANAFSGDAVFIGQLMQGRFLVFIEPSPLNDVPASFVESVEGIVQLIAPQFLRSRIGDQPFRAVPHIREIAFGGQRPLLAVIVAAIERHVSAAHAGFHLPHRVLRHVEIAGERADLIVLHPAKARPGFAEIEKQLALRFGRSNFDDAPVAKNKVINLRANPVHRERHQAHVTGRIVALDGLHQPDIALLYQIGQRQSVTHEAARDTHYMTQM